MKRPDNTQNTIVHLNIDYSLCKGCGGCAEAFPHLFEMRDERAWVINAELFDPEKDNGVMTVCPYYAIRIEKSKCLPR